VRKVRSVLRSISVRLFRIFNAKEFRRFGKGVYVFSNVDISGRSAIVIGDGVVIHDETVLSVQVNASRINEQLLSIGSGSNIGRRNHFFALRSVTIGCNVITASNVYISDCTHDFSDPQTPIMYQPVLPLSPVDIGDGSWIGQNECIVGCRIGRNCVIGAGAVVLSDIPDFSVAVGAPARIVKTYNPVSRVWERPSDTNTALEAVRN